MLVFSDMSINIKFMVLISADEYIANVPPPFIFELNI